MLSSSIAEASSSVPYQCACNRLQGRLALRFGSVSFSLPLSLSVSLVVFNAVKGRSWSTSVHASMYLAQYRTSAEASLREKESIVV